MKIQEILRQSNCLSNITIDQVLFESSYPILFTGHENEQVYLFICHSVNSERMAWIVTRTTYDIIISMLENKITIRDAFMAFTSEKIILTYDKTGMHTSTCSVNEIDDNILPTAGQYMDAEAGEYDEEIQYYQTMIKNKTSTIECISQIIELSYKKQFDYTPKVSMTHFDSASQIINKMVKMLVFVFHQQQCINNYVFPFDGGYKQSTKNMKAYSKEIVYECQ